MMIIIFYCKDSEILSKGLFISKSKITGLLQATKKGYGVMSVIKEKSQWKNIVF